MGAVNRFVGYVAASASGSLFYAVVVLIQMASTPAGPSYSLKQALAILVWIYVFFSSIILMFLPWCIAVLISRLIKRGRVCYIAGSAAASSFVMGCITASLSPKPLFIEEQTFLEGVQIAAERQGWLLALIGVVGGIRQ